MAASLRRTGVTASLISGLVLLCLPPAAGAFEPDYESLRAAAIFPARALNGPDYHVLPEVVNRGLMNHYQLETAYGPMTARGDGELHQRLREIQALRRLGAMHEGALVARAAGQAVWRTGEAIVDAVVDPGAAAAELGRGIQRLLRRAGRKLNDAYRTVRHRVVHGPSTGAGPGDGRSLSQKTWDASRTFVRNRLGINRAYRNLAREVAVDPYTNNTILEAELDRLAKHAAGASLGGKLVIPRIPGLIGAVKDVGTLVWDKDPLGLLLYNEDRLASLSVPASLIRRFTGNELYSPTQQTAIVSALATMENVSNAWRLIEHAADAADEAEARFYTDMIALMSLYHTKRSAFISIQPTGSFLPVAVTRDRRAVVAFPVDQLRWTRDVALLAAGLETDTVRELNHRELWTTGRISDRARQVLVSSGWIPFTHAHQRLGLARPAMAPLSFSASLGSAR